MKKSVYSFIFLGITYAFSAYSHDQIVNIDRYHQNSVWQKSTAIALYEQFAKKEQFIGKTTILDVCSGDGKITANIAHSLPNGQVIGVDISKNMTDFSQQHYGTLPNVKFQTMDATQLTFNNHFDVITSFTCMHLIPNQKTALKNMHNSLKDKGKLLLLFPVVHGFGTALQDVVSNKKWAPYFKIFNPNWHFFAPNEYQRYLQETGFKAQRLEIMHRDETYPNKAIFADSISHWLPHLRILPENLKADFLEDLVNTYLKSTPPDADGQIYFYIDNLIVEAIKN